MILNDSSARIVSTFLDSSRARSSTYPVPPLTVKMSATFRMMSVDELASIFLEKSYIPVMNLTLGAPTPHIGSVMLDLPLGAVHPLISPVSLTPITLGALSSQGRLAMTSTASAPPTPMAAMPRPPPLGV